LLEFELFPHLDSVYYFGGQVKLLIKLLYNLVLDPSVSPAQAALFSLPGSESQHVVVLIRIGFPQEPEEGELELLPPVFPVVVNGGRELVSQVHLQQLFVLLLEEGCHPTLVPR